MECYRIFVVPRLLNFLRNGIFEVRELRHEDVVKELKGVKVYNYVRSYAFAYAFSMLTGAELPDYVPPPKKLQLEEDDCLLYTDISIKHLMKEKDVTLEIYMLRYMGEKNDSK